jgi:cellulose synthase/poly-beta-1,6-N-acetylglucosamine synthase-like glycosyltransferase
VACGDGRQHRRRYDLLVPIESRTSCAVIIPSFRRPDDLARCLAALALQIRPPDEIIVVLRAEDHESQRTIEQAAIGGNVRTVVVEQVGQVAALNAGAAQVRSDISAIIDDDCAPHRDWLSRLCNHFEDSSVAAVGGRDIIVVGPPDTELVREVGRLTPYGRPIGNHHKGCGPPRPVDFVKGANMAFRTEWLRRFGFDEGLLGSGAQVHNDLRLSLQVRRAGGTLIYDPRVAVDHHAAPRKVGGERASRTSCVAYEDAYNETVAVLSGSRPARAVAYLIWAVICGTSRNPGVFVGVLAFVKGRPWGAYTFGACLAGRRRALRTVLRTD